MQQANEPLEPSLTYRLFTTALLFGLLLEWLLLWLHAGEWSSLLHPTALIWMTVIMLVVGLMKPRISVFILVGVIVCTIGLFVVFRSEGEHLLDWLVRLIPSFAHNLNEMFSYGIWYMTDEFRTLLLFTGWLLLAPSLQSMVWHYQLSLSLVGATIVYLLFFHVMLGSNVWLSLLRVIAFGLPLVALTTHFKLQHEHQAVDQDQKQQDVLHNTKFNRGYAISIGLFTILIAAGGFLVSDSRVKQSEPVAWADLFSFSVANELAAWSQQSGGMPLKHMTSSNYRNQVLSASGYDQDDSLLGQTLQPSDEVVFLGWSSHEGYWRGEIRATYTGKGWTDYNSPLVLHKVADEAESAVVEFGNKGKGEKITQSITYTEPTVGMPLLQSGLKGVVLELQASNPDRQLSSYISEPTTGALYSPTADAEIQSYTLLTELPTINTAALQDVPEIGEQLAQRLWEEEMLREFLQLPEELPERVSALASEVSGGGWTSRYDQVKAIEQYLKENYNYSLKSKLPSEDEDFVDHFLFEQQQGYCVHFATSMVVMLRTQDIPARLVKGFQSGEVISERTEEGVTQKQYKVRAQDAHAWVEVYFPEVGWLPFDPTPAEDGTSGHMGAFLQDAKQLGNDMLAKLQTWGSELSIFGQSLSEMTFMNWSFSQLQWLWIAVAGIILIGIIVALMLSLLRLRRSLLLRSYAVCYRKLEEGKRLLNSAQIYRGTGGSGVDGFGEAGGNNPNSSSYMGSSLSYMVNPSSLPARSKRGTANSRPAVIKQSRHQNKLQYRKQSKLQAKLQIKLHDKFLAIVVDCLQQLEKQWIIRTNGKIGDKQGGYLSEMTWRSRITALISVCEDADKCEQLQRLLQLIEKLHYSSDRSLPDPQVLVALLNGLLPRRYRISRKQRREQYISQLHSEAGAVQAEQPSEVQRSTI